MGWFGMNDASSDAYIEFKRTFNDWLKTGDPNDWIAIVDCHT